MDNDYRARRPTHSPFRHCREKARFGDKALLLAKIVAAAVMTQKTEKLRCRRIGRRYVLRDISAVYLLIVENL